MSVVRSRMRWEWKRRKLINCRKIWGREKIDVALRIASFMQVFAETFSQDAGGNPMIESLTKRNHDANLDRLSIAMNTINIGVAEIHHGSSHCLGSDCLEHIWSGAPDNSCSAQLDTLASFVGKELDLTNEMWRDLITKTLACVMDCGLEWIDTLAVHGFNNDESDLRKAGLQKLLDCEEEVSRNHLMASSINWKAENFPEAQSLMILVSYMVSKGAAVETNLGQSMDYWQPVCIVNETGSKALTFVRGPLDRKIFGVTPLTLFPDLPGFYSELFRAWTLVKGDPERELQSNGEWVWKYHSIGKSKIFGQVMSPDEEHGFATIVRNVRIYGTMDLPL